MKSIRWMVVALLLVQLQSPARLQANKSVRRTSLQQLNRQIHGYVVDHSHNHGTDRRVWSQALCQKRDLYVYLPPGFDPGQQYPLVVWLHGYGQDEDAFLKHLVPLLDRAITCGNLPPAIVAAPDGSINGQACCTNAGSFFLNTQAGRFEDYLMQDVWNFVMEHYPIRMEPEAHALVGVSMGGGAAFNLGIKYRDRVKSVVGIFPPLNTRWKNCRGRYMANFDPCCWGWRTDTRRPREVVGRFYGGLISVRLRRVLSPLYDLRSQETLPEISRENPIEMLLRGELPPHSLNMYIAYGGRDEFNMDAQIESFLYVARQQGQLVQVGYDPNGRHNVETAKRLFPGVIQWLAVFLAPYSPSTEMK